MLTCQTDDPGWVPVWERWKFVSHPSDFETVSVSRGLHDHACKWWCHLTDFEWEVKEPLRMIHSAAVTTHSVPTDTLYMQEVRL